jgi:hypothetical protein
VKTLKPGNLDLAKPWYLRATFRCGHCLGEFRPETEEEVEAWDDQRDGQGAAIVCPTCGERIYRRPER